MKLQKIAFNGIEKTDFDKQQHSDENLELTDYYLIETTTRDKDNRKEIDFKKNQVFEFEFEDGTSWIAGPDTLDDIFPDIMSKVSRSVSGDNVFELPIELSSQSTDRSVVGKVLLKAFKIFARKKTAKKVKELAGKLEDKQLDGKIGLFSLDKNLQFQKFIPDANEKPYLLLIHGTASSTSGSFGKALGTDFANFISDQYRERILAFQHRTLTENPLQNVKDLVTALPNKCALHLITTSRGGLVGEVLSRFCNNLAGKQGFNATELKIFENEYPQAYYSNMVDLIKEISRIVSEKEIKIEKFIRIACPAGGTTLASKRLDYFFNISLNLIGLATGAAANPVYMAFRSLIASLVDSKNKPEVLPGLEVQSPASPFIKALNCPFDLENPGNQNLIDNSLVVVAGNSKPALKLSALIIIASKLFFLRKNDLVVDTEAMSLGTKRTGKVLRFFYEDSQLNHFKYFENTTTNQAILTALKTEWGKTIPGFTEEPLSVLTSAERNVKIKPAGGKLFNDSVSGTKPIVLLLPGIMGSNLEYDEKLYWVNYFKIISGGLASLKINKKATANSLVSTAYEPLFDELKNDYDVVTFPFDWRKPLTDSASLLDRKIKQLLKHNQPIKIIGHSMGGVLIRDFIVLFKETWNNLNHSDGFRLILLGVPLNGSYRIPAVLFGMDRLINKLSIIDLVHSKKELIQIFSEYKGLLSLLPLDDKHDFAKPETWKEMQEGVDEEDWPLPSQDDLNWFKDYRGQMKDALNEDDFKHAVYIAGRDKATTCDYDVIEKKSGKELVFYSTAEGDFSVTWESGIPQLLKDKNAVYYTGVSHGELACNPDMFKGIKEILINGSTNIFPAKQPSVRGEEKLFKAPEFRDFDLSEAGIDLSVLGIGGGSEPQMKMPPIAVSISHGNLYYSKYPLLAGHFEDDGILSAEKQINQYLGDMLNHRHSLGIYPGRIGTNDLFLTEKEGFRGAIIIGLGKPENLTSYELTKTVEQGICNYLLSLKDDETETKDNKIKYVGVSSLIIGGGYGGLSVEDSIKGIIQGIYNANVKIRNIELDVVKQVGNIEFVELFEDAAISALYTLGRLENQETRSFNILMEEKKLRALLGGKKRIQNQFSSGWWNRITVKKEDNNDKNTIEHLTFSASTSRAHEKETPLLSTPSLLEGTIKEISTNNRWTPQIAKAIFELLIPNDFKEQLKRHGNYNWIVDHYTAEYPWELLQDEVVGSKPLCVAAGMIRQLSTQNYNRIIKSSSKNNVLVIADPDLKGFSLASQLPGALKEGQLVAAKLSSHGMSSTTSFKGNSEEIIEKMFSDNYRIIHLSGHGIYNPEPGKGSGMLIGKDMYLSTREIQQMSTAPELVFVNCCHIGKISGAAEELYRQRYKLAANIGTQLIENGVRCVIAAGWAVDDNAALEFASVFYDRLLTGYTFGEAVHAARKSVYEKYNSTNTWGAYQCYGDPFFRFQRRQQKEKDYKKSYMISQEAEIDLLNMLSDLEVGNKSTVEYIKILEEISEGIEKARIRTPEITELEAQIYLELKDFDKACEKFSSLLNVAEASFSFSVAEKYFMAMAKKIITDFKVYSESKKEGDDTEWQKKIEEKRTSSIDEIQKVTIKLESLVQLLPSSERINILGSTYKRKAFILNKNKEQSYEMAAYNYQRAYYFSKNWYSLTNWLALECTLVIAGLHKWDSDIKINDSIPVYKLVTFNQALEMLDTTASSLCENKDRMSYWDMLAGINIGLCKYIMQHADPGENSNSNTIRQKDILKEIGDLWKKAGSKGKRFAEIEHIEFIIDALSGAKNNDLAEKLKQLKQNLLDVIQ